MKIADFRGRTGTRLATFGASSRLPLVVAAVLIATLGARVGTLTWALAPEAGPAAPASAAPASPQSAGSGEEPPTARLAQLHLFGQEPVEPSQEQAAADAPETKLNLTLKGLFVAGNGDGMAIIAAGNGDDAIYSVGDAVVGNATITAILRDRVVVERDGVREVLLMEGVDMASDSSGSRRTTHDATQQRRVETARRLRQKFRAEPGSLARTVRFRPARDDGELIGYHIQSRSSELSLEELGVRPSDVVTQVNGVPLTDPRRANEVLMSLRDAQSIQLNLLRNGQRRTLSIPIGAPT